MLKRPTKKEDDLKDAIYEENEATVKEDGKAEVGKVTNLQG